MESSYEGDEKLVELIRKLMNEPEAHPPYKLSHGLVRYHNRIVIGEATDLRKKLIKGCHDSVTGGHSGARGTYEGLKKYFFWSRVKQEIIRYIQTCDVCQRCKSERVPLPGLLQPFSVPEQAWTHISMDFIEQLPLSCNFDTIRVVVDRFTKYGHFIGMKHPFSAAKVAKVFVDNVH